MKRGLKAIFIPAATVLAVSCLNEKRIESIVQRTIPPHKPSLPQWKEDWKSLSLYSANCIVSASLNEKRIESLAHSELLNQPHVRASMKRGLKGRYIQGDRWRCLWASMKRGLKGDGLWLFSLCNYACLNEKRIERKGGWELSLKTELEPQWKEDWKWKRQ